jgi:F-type H+-transporting ATPase subunit c
MRTRFANLVVVASGLLLSSLAFAQDGTGTGGSLGLVALGAAVAIGLAAFGAASGQGRAVQSALEGIARNPGAKDQMFLPLILGLVFMEFQALLGFVIAIMWTTK